jgi:hypothetical protein
VFGLKKQPVNHVDAVFKFAPTSFSPYQSHKSSQKPTLIFHSSHSTPPLLDWLGFFAAVISAICTSQSNLFMKKAENCR